ncbi:GGDEF domain-containing protein [Methylomonas montana]|uniref:GGDEF domain-containing protein n=1 Tax=Methylomonas montana TaxID=3058963 RepID=UPI002658E1DC|nr:GGDEF domain-containing protein [Methylomonas montana]WKJ92107.1 GGDEF domain-containing protein [Methylomonas montana]
MTDNPQSKSPVEVSQAKPLTKVLEQSRRAKDMVAACAEQLSSVNTVLKDELAGQNQPSGLEEALEKSESIECEVQAVDDQLSAVNHALEIEADLRQRLEQQLVTVTHEKAAADHAAVHDPLTGLPNRALFDERLKQEIAQVKHQGVTLAVMFMDLDGFKKINDTHGHDIGDAVLKIVAERLKQTTREGDTVSRQGGDEFLYLMVGIGDNQDTILLAKNILNAIQEPCQLSVGELIIKLSIGISIYPKDGTTGPDLIKSADKAMYEAKQKKSGYAFVQ